MRLLLKLVTKSGQYLGDRAGVFYVVQNRDSYVLHTHGLAPMRFASLAKLAHTLGGMVSWDRWVADTQLQLDYFNLRGAF